MAEKIDVTLRAEDDLEGPVECEISFDPEFIGHDAEFRLVAEVRVKDSRPVHSEKIFFEQKFRVQQDIHTFEIPRKQFHAYSYKGDKIDIRIHTRVKVDDALIFDTKVSEEHQVELGTKPEVANDARVMIEPNDIFKFFENLKAIPAHNQMITLVLLVIGGIIMLVNAIIGIHDQLVPESMTYLYSHVDSDGESQSPLVAGLAGSGVLGLLVWFAIRHQLRKYMKFSLSLINQPARILPQDSYRVSSFFTGKSRVPLENITLRIVACNMEKGQYVRGSGTDQRTVSFSDPVRGVLLYEKHVDHIPARTPIRDYFNDDFSFGPMFSILFPPLEISSTHGLDVHWEIQLLHPDFVDQELIGLNRFFHYEDFLAGST